MKSSGRYLASMNRGIPRDPLSCWPRDSGPAVVRVRRIVSRGIAGFLALALLLVLPDVLNSDLSATSRGWSVAVAILGYLVASRGLRGRFGARDLVAFLGVVLLVFAVADPTGSILHFAGGLVIAAYFLACATSLSFWGVAAFCTAGAVGSVGVQWSAEGAVTAAPADLALLLLGMAVSASAFMRVLIDRAWEIDQVSAETLAVQLALEQAQARDRAAARVQRVLHDEVIGALRTIAECGEADVDRVRAAAGEAVAAIEAVSKAASA